MTISIYLDIVIYMKATGYFKALADETRLRLLNLCLHYEMSVNEIVEIMNMGQSRISRHLKILTDQGLLKSRRDGFWTFYSTASEGAGTTFTRSIRYLFEQESLFKEDLDRAKLVRDERSKEMVRFFDSIAGNWEKLKSELIGDLAINELILKHIKPVEIIADLGCGTGDLAFALAAKAEDRVIGVEKSPKMLDEARRRFAINNGNSDEKIDLRIGELEHLPLREGEADTAVINMVLHHLPDPAAAFAEIHRVLKPGGDFLIVDLLSHHQEDMRERYGDRWLGFNETEIREWLDSSGFQSSKMHTFELKNDLAGFIIKTTKKL